MGWQPSGQPCRRPGARRQRGSALEETSGGTIFFVGRLSVTRRERIRALVILRRVETRPQRARSRALQSIDDALQAHPNEPDLLLLKGHLLDRLGHYQA